MLIVLSPLPLLFAAIRRLSSVYAFDECAPAQQSLPLPSYSGLDILAGAMDKRHDTEHWIYPRWSWEEAAVAHEKAFHAVYFSVLVGY